MQSGAPTCTDAPMKPAFQPEHIDYSTMFNISSSIQPTAWNLSSEVQDSTSPVSPNTNDPLLASTITTTNLNNHTGSNNTSPVSIRNAFDPSLITTVVTSDNIDSTFSKPPSPRTSNNNNPKPTPEEDEMVRRIHRKVGGPAKLSTYDEPARVRRVVIEALANEQKSDLEACRIRRGQLSASERRVVRTVTNRGAAVRSRMRQRKEMAALRMQVRARDGRVKQLEAVVRALCSAYAVPLPPSVIPNKQEDQENINISLPSMTRVVDDTISQQQQNHQSQQHHHHQQQNPLQNQHQSQNVGGTLQPQQQGVNNGTFTQSLFGTFGESSVTPLTWS